MTLGFGLSRRGFGRLVGACLAASAFAFVASARRRVR